MSGAKRKPIDFKVTESGCFEVTSHYREKDGYVRIRRKRKSIPIHRFIYEEMFGGIPDGLIVRHKCDNPSCSNPEHLEIGTQKENMDDKVKRKRCKLGMQVKSSKLNDEQVFYIKFLSDKETQVSLARRFGVTQALISSIQTGKRWKHIEKENIQ